jgi:DNA (cytosine-5)-methyltransferase 1
VLQQTSIFDFINCEPNKYKIKNKIRLIELFAGIGSQAKALKNIGADFEHSKVVEFDKYAIASYNAIHGTNFVTQDITKIKGSDLEIVDTNKYCYIMTYSFPCQDLSLVGKQAGMAKGSSTRSGLLWEVERLLNETKELPQILLMENVPQVHGKKNIQDFEKWIEFLQSKGYSNYWKDLNAKDYGIPQNRNRTFMVSILGSYEYEFPKPFELKLRLKDLLEENVDEKWFLTNQQKENIKKSLYVQNQRRIQRKDVCDTLCARDWKDPKVIVLGNYSPSNHNASRIVDSEGLAPTVMENHMTVTAIIDGEVQRKLTPHEYWRLMGFDDEDYEKAAKVNSNTQLYKQAGNSIVVNVLEAIFKELL